MTQYRLVPQSSLDEIEEARKELYAMFGGVDEIDTPTLCKLQKISDPMWRISHKNWEKLKGDT